jgi:hypothetical protein
MGPGFLENAPGACQDDLPTNIAAIRRFLRACIVKPVSQDDFEEILAFNMIVKPNVRRAFVGHDGWTSCRRRQPSSSHQGMTSRNCVNQSQHSASVHCASKCSKGRRRQPEPLLPGGRR